MPEAQKGRDGWLLRGAKADVERMGRLIEAQARASAAAVERQIAELNRQAASDRRRASEISGFRAVGS